LSLSLWLYYSGPEVQITTANQKRQRQMRKHNGKKEMTTANQKTQRQIKKHNGKLKNTTAKK